MPANPPKSVANMRRKCSIQQQANTQDSYGHPNAVWTDFINPIWCEIVDYQRPLIRAFSEQVLTIQIYEIKFRYRPGITKKMRIKELQTGRLFTIIDISDMDSLHQWHVLRCVEFK